MLHATKGVSQVHNFSNLIFSIYFFKPGKQLWSSKNVCENSHRFMFIRICVYIHETLISRLVHVAKDQREWLKVIYVLHKVRFTSPTRNNIYSIICICHKNIAQDIWLYHWVYLSKPKNTWPIYPERVAYSWRMNNQTQWPFGLFQQSTKRKMTSTMMSCPDCSPEPGQDEDVKSASQSVIWQGPFLLLAVLFDKWH